VDLDVCLVNEQAPGRFGRCEAARGGVVFSSAFVRYRAEGESTLNEGQGDREAEPGIAERSTRGASIQRNAAFALVTQATTAAFTAGLTLYLVRALGPAGYGIFALALSFGGLVLLPSDFGISQSAARFIAERRGAPQEIGAVIFDAVRLKLVIGAALAVALAALAGPIADLYGQQALAWPLRAVAIAIFGQSMMQLFTGAFYALGRASENLRLVLGESAMEVTASVALVLLLGGATAAASGRAVGYLGGAVLGSLLFVRLVGRRAFARRAGGPGVRRLGGYAGALMIIDGAFALFSQLGVLLVGGLLGAAAAGVYAAPLRLAPFLHYPGYSIAAAVAPRMARHPDQPPRVDAFARSLRYLLIFQLALVIPIVVWAQPIVSLVLGDGFERSAAVLQALAPFIFMNGFAPLLALSVNYVGEARRRVPIAVACVLVHLGLSLLLIDEVGVVGAAISVNVGFALYTGAHLWLCRTIFDLRLAPLGATVIRGVLASGAFAGVLFAFGTTELSVADWLLGSALGATAFAAVLIATKEVTPAELRSLVASIRRRRAGA